MKGRGFAGKFLYADLTERRTWSVDLDEDTARRYVGGLGLCVKLAQDHLPPGAGPLSPENVIVLGIGPMVGTLLPASSRVYAVTKLPGPGTVGWCGAGGFTFGAHLKYAGFDHVVIFGRADRPVRIDIRDDSAEIHDADSLWGLGVDETREAIRDGSDDPPGVLAIGPAGENLAVYSLAFVDRISTLGRGGFGAVMGAKNLKAVTVRGTGCSRVYDRRGFNRLRRDLMKTIRAYPYLREWQQLGMLKAFPLVPRELYESLEPRRVACVSCPVGCKDAIRLPDGSIKHTSSAINLFTPLMYGMKDHWAAMRLVTELDTLGLDMFEFFGLLAWVRELAAEKRLDLGPDDPDIALDSFESLSAWAKRIAARRGLGDLLAGGFAAVLDRLGPSGAASAPALVKHMRPYAGPGAALPWDRFGTMELGQVLDPRGPHVGSGGSPTYFALRPLDVFPKHLERMGVPAEAHERILGKNRDRLSVGRLLRYSHAWFTILGSMGVCARGQVNRFYDAGFLVRAYEAATGIPMDLDALRRRTDRVWSALRTLNLREGLDPAAETPPEKWFGSHGFKDYLTGEPLTQAMAEEMKRDYFREWGWDEDTGAPPAP